MRYLNRGRGNRRGRRRSLHEDEDPLSGVANLFDVAMVFALGLIVALVMQMQAQEALTNPEEMKEIIERAKVLEMTPQELVTISGEVTSRDKGTMITLGEGEDSIILWMNDSGEG